MVVGIDPGLSGALAFLFEDGTYSGVFDMPVMAAGKTGRQQVNAAALVEWMKKVYPPDRAVLEHVAAMPKQGVSSVFSFGQSFGIILGVLAALEIPVELVRPNVWKKAYGLGKDKEEARARAIQLYPAAPLSRKKDAGRAEALLLARYGRQP